MSRQFLHQQLLEAMEAELAAVGFLVTEASRQQMARMLDCIDHVNTSEQYAILCAELQGELPDAREAAAPVICDPKRWLATAECA